jgi:hypothetical protein
MLDKDEEPCPVEKSIIAKEVNSIIITETTARHIFKRESFRMIFAPKRIPLV